MERQERVFRLMAWENEKSVILSKILARKTKFKIVLKTKNQPEMLKDWIDHHAAIFGIESLVIVDNMSHDNRVFQVLQPYLSELFVFQYATFNNHLHDSRVFGEFHNALSISCDYLMFLDTDEFLHWIHPDGSVSKSREVFEQIASSVHPVMGIWVEDVLGDPTHFHLRKSQGVLGEYIRGGKPIWPTTKRISKQQCHNVDFGLSFFGPEPSVGLFVFHHKNGYPELRIRANVDKLRSYNRETKELNVFGLEGDDFDESHVLLMDPNNCSLSRNAKTYISSTQAIMAVQSGHIASSNIREEDLFQVRKGYVHFECSTSQKWFLDFLNNPTEFLIASLNNKGKI